MCAYPWPPPSSKKGNSLVFPEPISIDIGKFTYNFNKINVNKKTLINLEYIINFENKPFQLKFDFLFDGAVLSGLKYPAVTEHIRPSNGFKWKKIYELWLRNGIAYRENNLPAETIFHNETVQSHRYEREIFYDENGNQIHEKMFFVDNYSKSCITECFYGKHNEKTPNVIHYDESGKITFKIWYLNTKDIIQKQDTENYSKFRALSYEEIVIAAQRNGIRTHVDNMKNNIIWNLPINLFHRLSGPAVIKYNNNEEPAEESWYLNGQKVPDDMPKPYLDKNIIIGKIDKNMIFDIMLNYNREYGSCLFDIFNQLPPNIL